MNSNFIGMSLIIFACMLYRITIILRSLITHNNYYNNSSHRTFKSFHQQGRSKLSVLNSRNQKAYFYARNYYGYRIIQNLFYIYANFTNFSAVVDCCYERLCCYESRPVYIRTTLAYATLKTDFHCG